MELTMPDTLGFKWACFISYRSAQGELMQCFLNEFTQALNSYIEPYFGNDLQIYVDKERLKGGDFFNRELATNLCRSLCMITIFTPIYFDTNHRYCAREYKAMEFLEQKRISSNGSGFGLIIPVVLRGVECLPHKIKNNRMYYDFSKYDLCSPEISYNPNYKDAMQEIAKRVYEIYNHIKEQKEDFCECCSSFEFPDEHDDEIEQLVAEAEYEPVFPGRVK
jgi:hypothetical protein